MANAAAKKAAAAKAASADFYKPVLLGTNALYVLLLMVMRESVMEWSIWAMIGVLINWGLQGYAYMGILDQAANASSGSTSGKQKKALVGGANLDLLALSVVIQFGSLLHSTKWFYLLMIVPVWGGWTLYNTFKGASPSPGGGYAAETADDPSDSGPNADRRQKRAEKRKNKWS